MSNLQALEKSQISLEESKISSNTSVLQRTRESKSFNGEGDLERKNSQEGLIIFSVLKIILVEIL